MGIVGSLTGLTSMLILGTSSTVFLILFIMAFSWVFLFLFLCVHVMFVVSAHGSHINAYELRFLQSMGDWSTTFLFLPLTSVLIRGFVCSDAPDELTGMRCDGAGRVFLSLGIAIILVFFIIVSLFATIVIIDRNPGSSSWAAKFHGRQHVARLVAKIVLAVIFTLAPTDSLSSWPLLTFLTLLALVWSTSTYYFLPFIHAHMNKLQAAFSSCVLWICFWTMIAKVVGGKITYVAAFVGWPFVAYVSYKVTEQRIERITLASLRTLRSVTDITTWSAWRVQQLQQLKSQQSRNSSEQSDSLRSRTSPPQVHPKSSAGIDSTPAPAPREHRSVAAVLRDLKSGVGVDVADVNDVMDTLLSEARLGFRRLARENPRSELAHVVTASFHEHYSKFLFLEAAALADILRRSPSIDAQFQVYRRAEQIRNSEESLSHIDRLMFDKTQESIMSERQVAYHSLQALFESVVSAHPDLTSVHDAALATVRSTTRLNDSFKHLLKINPNSATALRGYATFLTAFNKDRHLAREMLNRANRVAAELKREHGHVVRHFEFNEVLPRTLVPHHATAVISAYRTNSGEILRASPGLVHLMGYSHTSDLVGRNISVLMPRPFADDHDSHITRMSEESASRIMGRARQFLAETAQGYLIPVALITTENPPDPVTSQPRFEGSFWPIECREHMILFGGAENRFAIYGATEGACDILRISPSKLRSESYSMYEFFPSLSVTSSDPATVTLEDAEMGLLRVLLAMEDYPDAHMVPELSVHRKGDSKKETWSGATGKDSASRPAKSLASTSIPSAERQSSSDVHAPTTTFVPKPLLSLTSCPGIIPIMWGGETQGDIGSGTGRDGKLAGIAEEGESDVTGDGGAGVHARALPTVSPRELPLPSRPKRLGAIASFRKRNSTGGKEERDVESQDTGGFLGKVSRQGSEESGSFITERGTGSGFRGHDTLDDVPCVIVLGKLQKMYGGKAHVLTFHTITETEMHEDGIAPLRAPSGSHEGKRPSKGLSSGSTPTPVHFPTTPRPATEAIPESISIARASRSMTGADPRRASRWQARTKSRRPLGEAPYGEEAGGGVSPTSNPDLPHAIESVSQKYSDIHSLLKTALDSYVPELYHLRNTFVVLLLLSLISLVTFILVLSNWDSQSQETFRGTVIATKRSMTASHAFDSLRMIASLESDIDTFGPIAALSREEYLEELDADVRTILSLNTEEFDLGSKVGARSHKFVRSHRVDVVSEGSTVVTQRTLHDLTKLMTTSLKRAVADKPRTSLSTSHYSFIAANIDTWLDAQSVHLSHAQLDFEDAIENNGQIVGIVALPVTLVLLLLGCLGLAMLVSRVVALSDRVLATLFLIPKSLAIDTHRQVIRASSFHRRLTHPWGHSGAASASSDVSSDEQGMISFLGISTKDFKFTLRVIQSAASSSLDKTRSFVFPQKLPSSSNDGSKPECVLDEVIDETLGKIEGVSGDDWSSSRSGKSETDSKQSSGGISRIDGFAVSPWCSRYGLWVLFRSMFFVLSVVVCVGVIGLWHDEAQTLTRNEGHRTSILGSCSAITARLSDSTLTSVIGHGSVSPRVAQNFTTSRSKEVLELLEVIELGGVLPTLSGQTIKIEPLPIEESSPTNTILRFDGCHRSKTYRTCSSAARGILQNGMIAAMREYTSQANVIVEQSRTGAIPTYNISIALGELEAALDPHFRDAFIRTVKDRSSRVNETFNTMENRLLIALAASLPSIIALFVVMAYPAYLQLHNRLRNAIEILLLLPPNLFDRNEAARTNLKSLIGSVAHQSSNELLCPSCGRAKVHNMDGRGGEGGRYSHNEDEEMGGVGVLR